MSPLHTISRSDGSEDTTLVLPFITAISNVHNDPNVGFRFWVCIQGNETRIFSYGDKDKAADRRRGVLHALDQWWEQVGVKAQ